MKVRNVFLTILEAVSLRSECQYGQVLVRALFRVSDRQLPGKKGGRALWDHSYKGTNPIHEFFT